MKIDVHAHYVPEKFVDQDAGAPGSNSYAFRITRDGGQEPLYADGPRAAAGFDASQLWDLPRRLRDMAQQDIDMQALSAPPFFFFYHLDAPTAQALCRLTNDAFAATVAQHPGSFVALANVPLQAPEQAAAELERAVRELDMRGAEICSNINGLNLDHAGLAPFYAKAQELDVPIFIHPSNVLGADRLGRYHLGNLIGNPTDTAVAAASLIFGGVLKEYPRLKVYLAHGGGSCPYLRGRWEHGWHVRPEAKALIQRPPSEYLRLLYFDSLIHYGPGLNFLVESVGPERVMMGTDYPFDMGDYASVKAISGLPHLSDGQKELIYGENAAALLRIG
ncbi:MAG: amidohydrolase [Chloroflexi bacterium]|nr:amidohydrolase [Chloroflexota bacterium]